MFNLISDKSYIDVERGRYNSHVWNFFFSFVEYLKIYNHVLYD